MASTSSINYKLLFDSSADAMMIMDQNGFLDCNPATVNLFGYNNRDDLLSIHPSQLSPEFQPDGQASFDKANEMISIALKEGSNRFEWMHQCADGQDFWAEVLLTCVTADDLDLLHVVLRNITERIEAQKEIVRQNKGLQELADSLEEKVKRRTQQLDIALDNMPDGLVLVDEDMNFQLYNKKIQRMFEVPDEVMAQCHTMYDIIEYQRKRGDFGSAKEDQDRQIQTIFNRLNKKEAFVGETTLANKKRVEIRVNQIPSSKTKILTYSDITGREFKSRQLKLGMAFENIPMFVCLCDEKDNVVFCNTEYRNFLGLSDSFLKSGTAYKDILKRIVENNFINHTQKDDWVKSRLNRRKKPDSNKVTQLIDGRYIESNDHILEDGSILFVARDITERIEMQQELVAHRDHFEQLVEKRTAELRILQEEQREQANLLQIVLDNMIHGISLFDLDMKLKFFNKQAVDILDLPGDLIRPGMSFEEMIRFHAERGEFGDGDIEDLVQERVATAKDIKPHRVERKRHDGRILEITGTPIDGVGTVIAYDDISERSIAEQKIRESEQRFKDILDKSPFGVGISDLETGEVLYANVPCAHLFGHYKDDWRGEKVLKLWTNPKDRESFVETFKKQGHVPTQEIRLRRVDGSEFWGLLTWDTIRLENKDNILFWVLDISNLKDVQEQLANAKVEAEAATEAKSNFLATMSHEIRTPMNAIIGMSHLFGKTDLNSRQQDYNTKILFSAEALLRIINDILDFSKIEAGKLEIEKIPFQLNETMEALSNIVSMKAQEKGLEILFDIDSNVPNSLTGDPLRLGQILINLVNNSVKFTEEGEVIVSAGFEERDDGQFLCFCVSDTGIGMTKDQSKKLFASFSQVDGTITRKYGGTGLGLAISKQLSELMGGCIWVESEKGKGSQFYFEIQVDKIDEQPSRDFNNAPEFLKILIVDDNESARLVLRNIVTGFGFHADMVNSGQEAIDIISKNSIKGDSGYDVILMDWMMPEMDGIETSSKIRNLEQKTKIKVPSILMVSAHNREELIQKAQGVGLNGFLTKPVSASDLFDALLNAKNISINHENKRVGIQDNLKTVRSQIGGAKILLVEDNAINRQVATEFLQDVGLVVDEAHDGLQGLEKVNQNSYDLVLMDIQMPNMDGLTATRKIRENEQYKNLPIVAMTAHAMNSDREKSKEAGVNGHITKPFIPEVFYQVLADLIPARPQTENLNENIDENDDDGFLMDFMAPDDDGNDGFEMEFMEFDQIEDEPEIDLPPSASEFSFTYIAAGKAIALLGGKTERYMGLLNNYKKDYLNVDDVLQAHFDKKDYDQAKLLVHSLKSVSAYLGADTLNEYAVEIETCLIGEDYPEALKLLPKFKVAARNVAKDLRSFEDGVPALELTLERDPEVVTEELYQAIETGLATAEKLAEELVYLEKENIDIHAKSLNLLKMVQELEYEKAKICMKEIAQLQGNKKGRE